MAHGRSRPPHQLIPIGGGLLRLGETREIDQYIVSQSTKDPPTVLFLPTASSDLPEYIQVFEAAYRDLGCQVKTVQLIRRHWTHSGLKQLLLTSDIIYVGGGNSDLLLEELTKAKLVPILREAYLQGAVLTGLSAGCAIWYDYFLEEAEGGEWQLRNGLGFLKGVNLPHYKPHHRPPDQIMQNAAAQHPITAIPDNTAVHYKNETAIKVVGTGKKVFTFVFLNGRLRTEPISLKA